MRVKLNGIKTVTIDGDFIKLDALLKFTSCVSTGGEAKYFISNGDVIVNGESETQRGKKIRHGDIVRFDSSVFKIVRKQ